MRESGWLIERAPHFASPQYLIVVAAETDSPQTCLGSFAWSPSHHFALRFARKTDAIVFVGALRALSEALPHSRTLPGLRSGDEAPNVCEHMWDLGVAPQDTPGGTGTAPKGGE